VQGQLCLHVDGEPIMIDRTSSGVPVTEADPADGLSGAIRPRNLGEIV
jgi:hypothetical protein